MRDGGIFDCRSRRILFTNQFISFHINMVEFHVLRCADCQTFQVLQVTKTAKWKCKMCGQKQSITKVYGQGSGADCRRHVQKLNSLQCQTKWTVEEHHLMSASQIPASLESSCSASVIPCKEASSKMAQGSRWSSFIDESDDDRVESLQADEKNNLEFKMTTDWMEYQEHKKTWNKRRYEPENEFPVSTGKKSKKFVNERNSFAKRDYDIQGSSKPVYESHDGQVNGHNINIPMNSESGIINHSASMFRVVACDRNNLSLPSLSAGEVHDGKISRPCPLSPGLRDDNTCSYDPHIDVLRGNAGTQSWVNRQLVNDVPQNSWKESRERPAQNKKKCKQASTSGTVVASKWGMYLDSEDNADDCDEESDNSDSLSDNIFVTVLDSGILDTEKQDLD